MSLREGMWEVLGSRLNSLDWNMGETTIPRDQRKLLGLERPEKKMRSLWRAFWEDVWRHSEPGQPHMSPRLQERTEAERVSRTFRPCWLDQWALRSNLCVPLLCLVAMSTLWDIMQPWIGLRRLLLGFPNPMCQSLEREVLFLGFLSLWPEIINYNILFYHT